MKVHTITTLWLCIFYNQLMHKYIYIIIFSLYNVHSYMFWHLCVILREFQNLYFAKLHKFLEMKVLKLQSKKILD